MKNKIKVVLLIILGSCISVVILVITSSNKEESRGVIFKSANIIGNLQLEKETELDRRYSVMKSYGNSIYFVSWEQGARNKLFRFNQSTLLPEKEYSLATDRSQFKIDNYEIFDDSIVILNKDGNKLETFDNNFKKRRALAFPQYCSRMVISNGKILYSDWDDSFNMYYRHIKDYNFTNNLEINADFMKEYGSGIIYDGFFYQNNKYVVQIPYAANKIIVFDENLNYQKSVFLRYNDLGFNFVKASNGDTYPSPTNLIPNLAGDITLDNKLYLLMTEATQFDKYNKCFIDIYSLNNGDYLGSYPVPDLHGSAPRHILVEGNKFIILYDKHLAVYKISI